jgi:hypothetical protein
VQPFFVLDVPAEVASRMAPSLRPTAYSRQPFVSVNQSGALSRGAHVKEKLTAVLKRLFEETIDEI